MNKYLLFQLFGNLQAWGTPCPGDVRNTDDHPTKSGVLGLVSSCMGIHWEDFDGLDKLFKSMNFSCRVDVPGSYLEDLQIVKHGDRNGEYLTFEDAIMSTRYYLVRALFTVCLWKNNRSKDPALEELAKSLNKPIFPSYLGRSNCLPSLPYDPKIIEARNIREAYGQYTSDRGGHLKIRKDFKPKVFWEGGDRSVSVTRKIFRYDVPQSRKSRTFSQRVEFEGRL